VYILEKIRWPQKSSGLDDNVLIGHTNTKRVIPRCIQYILLCLMLHAESRGFSLVSHISNTNKDIQLKDIPYRNHGKINSLHVYVCAPVVLI
jgi:hypothetical protein